MKSVMIGSILVALVTLSHQAMAQCPSSLNAEQMQECIVTENAGYFYTPNATATATTSEQQVIAPATANAAAPSNNNQAIVSAQAKLQNQ